MHAMVLLLLVKIGAVRKWFSTVTSQKVAGEKQEPFGSKICLAKVLATTNFGTQLVGIQKNSPPHKVLTKILAKKFLPIFWPALVLARQILTSNQSGPIFRPKKRTGSINFRGRLVVEAKNFGCQIKGLTRCREGFSNTN